MCVYIYIYTHTCIYASIVGALNTFIFGTNKDETKSMYVGIIYMYTCIHTYT
jgi:hypothetical protein